MTTLEQSCSKSREKLRWITSLSLMSHNNTWQDCELCHFNGTLWCLSRHTVYVWMSNTGLWQCYYFSYVVEAMRCTWTSAHDVSFITGCHCTSVLSDREDAHLLRLFCWMYRSSRFRWHHLIEKNNNNNKNVGLMIRNTGSRLWQKNKHTDVLSGCSYPQIYLTFSGVCTRWSQGYTFTSCFRLLLKFDLMAFFFFFLKTCKTQGLFRPHVYMIVFFQMRLLSYCWRWTIDLSRRGDLYFNDQLLLFRLNYWSVFYCIMCSF